MPDRTTLQKSELAAQIETAMSFTAMLFGIILCFVVYFIIRYRKKQLEHFTEKKEMQEQFESTQLQSQLEIKEQTLQYIAQEIHDNVGQRLTLAALHVEKLQCTDEVLRDTAAELIENAISDLRNLSRSISGNFILEKGIELALEREAQLITSSRKMQCTFTCTGEHHGLNEQQEIILFRCAQEALNNAVKHSGGNQIDIYMEQSPEHMALTIDDNGKGMNMETAHNGVGMGSIHQRIALLNGTFKFDKKEEVGTVVKFEIPTAND